MQRLQAFKYELMPNGEQQRQMRRFAGSCRFVFNKALVLQKSNYEAGGKARRQAARPSNSPRGTLHAPSDCGLDLFFGAILTSPR
jgi:transposase